MKPLQFALSVPASQFLALCWDVGAVIGAVFVIYGFLVASGVPSYPWLDDLLARLSMPVTLAAALAVFLSIYVQPSATPVKLQSQLLVSPVFIAACLGAAYLHIARSTLVPNSIPAGLSLCAIFGSLMRMVPRIHEK